MFLVPLLGDINFAHDLSDLRHRHGLNVILVHKSDSSEALKSCANSLIKYSDLITDLPYRSPSKVRILAKWIMFEGVEVIGGHRYFSPYLRDSIHRIIYRYKKFFFLNLFFFIPLWFSKPTIFVTFL